jgi:ribonucleoside-diphosphate reductase alpha chain
VKLLKAVDARNYSRKMAEAAWACADPGIQYDDTINDWHTNPETGRINASNPCSEYMSLDNSSCNLASLNLMKFLKADGSFDAKTFAKAAEMIITAMDISICFADFPTEAIGDTTKAYRQLGIGYANLGALLMASGLAYDSEGGRALSWCDHLIDDRYYLQAFCRTCWNRWTIRRLRTQRYSSHARVMRKHACSFSHLQRSETTLDTRCMDRG